jgi:hypothetical protein
MTSQQRALLGRLMLCTQRQREPQCRSNRSASHTVVRDSEPMQLMQIEQCVLEQMQGRTGWRMDRISKRSNRRLAAGVPLSKTVKDHVVNVRRSPHIREVRRTMSSPMSSLGKRGSGTKKQRRPVDSFRMIVAAAELSLARCRSFVNLICRIVAGVPCLRLQDATTQMLGRLLEFFRPRVLFLWRRRHALLWPTVLSRDSCPGTDGAR